MTLTRETNLQALMVPAASGSFVLNAFPATFSAETLNTYVGPHRDDQAFSELVEAQQDWTAWRDTDDGARVYVWCHVPDATFEWPRFQPATVSLPESPPLFCRVMLDGLNRHLLSKGFSRIGRDRPGPVGYVNWSVGNFLDGLDLAGFAPDPRVGMFPKIVLQSFTTRFGQAAPLINLTVDVAYTTRMDIPADELLEQGFDVCGRYVKLLPGAGGLETLEGLTIGRVAKVVGWDLLLEDLRPGAPERIPGAWCVLEPGRRTIEDYLRHAHPKHFRAIHLAMGARVSHVISPPEKLRLIEGFVKHRLGGLDQLQIPLADELSVCFGPPGEPSAWAETFRAMSLLSPTFSFDPESPKLHSSPDGGLKQYGPYSRSRMHAAKPRVLVLAPDMFKGQVEQFIDQFRSGIRGCEPTYNGFAKKYRLDGVEIVPRYFPWRNGAAKDVYYNATIDALDDSTDFALCFIVIREDFKRLPATENPYYICKAQLLAHGIVVQDLRIETLRQPESSLQWSLNTVALASYAKLGGAPFVLKARQVQQHELVFGIGRSIERPPGSRLGAAKQIIGFTTVFRSDGDYLLNTCTPYSTFSDYARRLEDIIRKTVEEVVAIEGIADGEPIRLIFHVYKRTGRREVDAVQNAIAKLTRYSIEFALLHINDSHGFLLFDRTNPGSIGRDGQRDESTALIPPRQLMVEIGPRERLINFIGPQQYRRRGMPGPLRITLDRVSTYRDLDSLAQQVYDFSFVSYRTFNPGIEPVTVRYATLMANLNSRLHQVAPAWNEGLVRTKLKRTLWFI